MEIDPENHLLWRMNARRLSFEEWRDTLLAVSGELDRTPGGRAAELFAAGGDNRRRTLYGMVDRQFLTSAMRTFDFANPDLHAPQRSQTIVSQQALFAMNHPFVAHRARGFGRAAQRNPFRRRSRPCTAALPFGLPTNADRRPGAGRVDLSRDAAGRSAHFAARDTHLAVWLRKVV